MSLRIGDLAVRTGVKVATIRWYEKVGLLATPDRTGANYRLYDDEALRRLTFIRRTRDLGFSLEQVRALLHLAANEESDCSKVDAIANGHLLEIDRKIDDLSSLRRELSAVISTCAGGSVGDCRILEAFTAGPARPAPPPRHAS